MTAIIGAAAAAASTGVQMIWDQENPLKELCVNEKNPTFKIKATLELIIDGPCPLEESPTSIRNGQFQRGILQSIRHRLFHHL